jgi:hypothetical protein
MIAIRLTIQIQSLAPGEKKPKATTTKKKGT